jgi:hypothetical protein
LYIASSFSGEGSLGSERIRENWMAYGAMWEVGARNEFEPLWSSEENGTPSAKWLFDVCCQQHRQLV